MAALVGTSEVDVADYYADDKFDSNDLFSKPGPGDGWEVLMNSPGKLQLWRKLVPGTSVYEYKSIGTSAAKTPEIFVKAAFLDLEYHKEWDVNCIDIAMIDRNDAGVEWVYWEVKYPWPMSNRDYVYSRKHFVKDDVHFQRSRAEKHPSKPAKSGKVRVDLYRCDVAVRDLGNGRCEYGSRAIDDPKSVIPSTILNYIIAKTIPSAMSSLETACNNYEGWKAKQPKE